MSDLQKCPQDLSGHPVRLAALTFYVRAIPEHRIERAVVYIEHPDRGFLDICPSCGTTLWYKPEDPVDLSRFCPCHWIHNPEPAPTPIDEALEVGPEILVNPAPVPASDPVPAAEESPNA